MRDATANRAILHIGASREKRYSATRTVMRLLSDSLVPALLRAVFERPMHSLARVERNAAVLAYSGTASIADLRAAAAWHEILSAAFAGDRVVSKVQQAPFCGIRIGVPITHFFDAMTDPAKRKQVSKFVSIPIIRKMVIGRNVMHRQILSSLSAMPTGIIISLSRKSTLSFPIWASVLSMAALPARTLFACPVPNLAPRINACAGAKVSLLHRVWLLLNLNVAGMTEDRYTLSTSTLARLRLPFAVASRIAKLVAPCFKAISRALDGLVALGARNHWHTGNYTMYGLFTMEDI